MWLYHPAWRISCSTCIEFDYNSKAELQRIPGTGEPLRRGVHQATPCASCPKVPRWAKAAGKRWSELRTLADELTPQHRLTVEAYYQYKAVGRFPDDPVVLWWAGILREAEDEYRATNETRTYTLTRAFMESLITLAARK